MAIHLPAKDPNESVVAYQLDWTGRLASGETISSSTWAVLGSPASLTISNFNGFNASLNLTQFFVSGGAEFQTYILRNTIVTSLGETLSRDASIWVKGQ